jgi:hypothetical protein
LFGTTYVSLTAAIGAANGFARIWLDSNAIDVRQNDQEKEPARSRRYTSQSVAAVQLDAFIGAGGKSWKL